MVIHSTFAVLWGDSTGLNHTRCLIKANTPKNPSEFILAVVAALAPCRQKSVWVASRNERIKHCKQLGDVIYVPYKPIVRHTNVIQVVVWYSPCVITQYCYLPSYMSSRGSEVEHPSSVWKVMGSIPIWSSHFFWVPCLRMFLYIL